MQGRTKTGWYRDPGDPDDRAIKVTRLNGSWIATEYDRRHRRPCACGTVVYPALWQRLEPADPIEGVSLDLPPED
jgi:hypothetical protein